MEVKDFRALRISLASPEEIRGWSYGEVTKPETINYRRLRPEKDGLFCEAIFGPTKDWQCYCGKYKQVRYKGIVCEKCGVLVTRSSVRRERMGHIELAAPVAHIWYTRRVPSYLGLLLDISRRNLDRVLYFAHYIITRVDENARTKALKRLDDELVREEKKHEDERQDKIDTITQQLDETIAIFRDEEEQIVNELNERQNSAIEALMQDAQTAQRHLEDKNSILAREPLMFTLAGIEEMVADKGEVIDSSHLKVLNGLVEGRLNEIKVETDTEINRERGRIRVEIDRLRLAADQESSTLDQQSTDEVEDIGSRVQEQRQELMSIKPMTFLNESEFRVLADRWGNIFYASMGAEALHEICRYLSLDDLAKELRTQIRTTRSKQLKKKAIKRLRVVESLRKSNNRPEWMILTVLPVIPPDLRPMVQLDGGRFATSDLNDLYRRVINRNNRLKRLLDLGAPDVIVRNEKRMLQEAVDSLIDNSRRGKAVSSRGRRQLKSLSDMLKGKQGRFRRNLLGKRVDYSGRSVIVVGAKLALHQCGLPKGMALELFRPFVIQKLVEYNYANNVKGAKRIVEQRRPEVWEVLEEVIQTRPIMLNRAPTLHRLGIQAFEPLLVEGSALQIHPLVCSAFNADFDGDQMAVHIPLSKKAVKEARELMLSSHNLLLPANGEPIVSPTKDMVLGVYYLTMEEDGKKGEGKIFANINEVELAYNLEKVHIHAKIKIMHYTSDSDELEPIETTVGRVLFNQVVPEPLRLVNRVLDKGTLKEFIGECYNKLGQEVTAQFVDDVKEIGFKFATISGATISISDINVPERKKEIIEQVTREVTKAEQQFRRGLISEEEQYLKTVRLWGDATEEVTEEVRLAIDPESPIKLMADSGATKGGFQPIRQLAGMRGLMTDPSGRIIALPIRSNFREGLTALEYFISTHGARKGLADTALRTADAGYLTRRLVDVSQDVIINKMECTCDIKTGMIINRQSSEKMGQTFQERLVGRVSVDPIVDPATGEVVVDKDVLISVDHFRAIDKAGVDTIVIRSPMHCGLRQGICSLSYGSDMGRGGAVARGTAVGIIAAQSIGEPGTQLTLRTFHTGGVAGTTDITHGLPRVQELFEARNPKGEAIISDLDGKVTLISNDDGSRVLQVSAKEIRHDEHPVPDDWSIMVADGDKVAVKAVIAQLEGQEVLAEHGGVVEISSDGKLVYVHWEAVEEEEYEIEASARLRVQDNDIVSIGEQLTEGSLNPNRILQVLGREAAQLYLLEEVQKVYRSQGVPISDKHIEVVVRQMTNKIRLVTSGESKFLPGELMDYQKFQDMNQELIDEDKRPASGRPVLLGITKAALNTDSFLSASSFQHTINVLAQAAIEGKKDNLFGLKENVILGKLIPAGTGYFHYYDKEELSAEVEEEKLSTEEFAEEDILDMVDDGGSIDDLLSLAAMQL
ncbi:DNA-directed RNA polymerase subunit beta' [Anaerolineales bacterium HSG6]|nr:DNA-directed RNA polymerase subunit beta' [Anaerolineales bacterium HSG6]MDM8529595.1 DNA-directed RNA polymerase subunit beta' [Anaerolineales bacterium HSG25]